MSETPTIEIFIVCSKSKKKFNLLARAIEGEVKLGFTHYAIVFKYDGQLLVSEAVWPRPRFISWEDWVQDREPVFIFRKEVKNQYLMFQMFAWMAILCTKSFYSILQLFLIYLRLRVPFLKSWVDTVKLNHEVGLVCSEYIIRFLNEFFSETFEIQVGVDSIGLKEPFDQLTSHWVLLDEVSTAVFPAKLV